VGKWLLASPSPAVIGQGYFKLVASSARDTVPRVLDVLDDDPDVDPHRLGIAGFSTNGFVALLAAAADARLRVAVAIAASGDLHCFLHRSTLAMNGEPLALDPKYDAWLRELDPRRHPGRLVHAALLMVNGRHDVAVPFVCAERTVGPLRRAYAAAHARDRFRFLASDEGHGFGAPERDAVLAWFRRWLGTG
jgi:dipeptidyl aminopeptidase/acylaminoacyl peptidase